MAALQCRCWQCLLLAQLRRHTAVAGIPLMGVKRKCSGRGRRSGFDPLRTLGNAPGQIVDTGLFDHLVGAAEQCHWDVET
jgi:hypothetical protein